MIGSSAVFDEFCYSIYLDRNDLGKAFGGALKIAVHVTGIGPAFLGDFYLNGSVVGIILGFLFVAVLYGVIYCFVQPGYGQGGILIVRNTFALHNLWVIRMVLCLDGTKTAVVTDLSELMACAQWRRQIADYVVEDAAGTAT